MSTKDVDFTKISIPADEFESMMRRALNPPLSLEDEKTKVEGDGDGGSMRSRAVEGQSTPKKARKS